MVAFRASTAAPPIEAPIPASTKLDSRPFTGSSQNGRSRGRQRRSVTVEILFHHRDERWVAEARDLRIACVARSRQDARTAIRAMLRSFFDGAEIQVVEVERPLPGTL